MATSESTQYTREKKKEAERARARALQQVSDLCETGQRSMVMRFLMVNMQHNPALKKIHLWQLDAVMFHTSYRRAISTVRKMRETIGDTSNITDGVASIGWALAGREESVRMSTWLYLLLLREKIVKFDLPEGFPYGLLFDNTTTETKEDELDAT